MQASVKNDSNYFHTAYRTPVAGVGQGQYQEAVIIMVSACFCTCNKKSRKGQHYQKAELHNQHGAQLGIIADVL